MNLFAQIADPTDLDLVRKVIASSERPDDLVPLGIKSLEISADASHSATSALAQLIQDAGGSPAGSRVVVLVDATPIYKGDVNLKKTVAEQLAQEFEVEVVVLGDEHHLYADDSAIDAASAALEGAAGVVSVGSGTISDIAKVASTRQGGVPHVLVQTAASVDGYTDNVSVVLKSGAKRTIDSRWPDVVLADTETIATAPVELNASGFGELLSLFTAPADWWLAFQAGTDKTFHTTPRDLLLTFAGNPAEWGAGIGDGNQAAVEQLTRVLAIRGIGTGIAGTTACLSGMEHLVSHMLDMYAAANGHTTGLHGKQVGVASVVGAVAWEYLLEQIRSGRAVNLRSKAASLEATVTSAFSGLDSTGALAAECWRDYAKKLSTIDSGALVRLAQDADKIVTDLGPTLPNSRELAVGLAKAGAAVGYRELDSWVTPQVWRWAVSNCHLMRNRVTIVDLLAELGWWLPTDVSAVLDRVDSLTKSVQND